MKKRICHGSYKPQFLQLLFLDLFQFLSSQPCLSLQLDTLLKERDSLPDLDLLLLTNLGSDALAEDLLLLLEDVQVALLLLNQLLLSPVITKGPDNPFTLYISSRHYFRL